MLANIFQLVGGILLVIMAILKTNKNLSNELKTFITLEKIRKEEVRDKLIEYNFSLFGFIAMVIGYALSIFKIEYIEKLEEKYLIAIESKIAAILILLIASCIIVLMVSHLRINKLLVYTNSNNSKASLKNKRRLWIGDTI